MQEQQSQGANKCRRELTILKLISDDGSQNPHLIRLLDHFVTQTNKLCLVFEYIDRTLLDVMDQHPNGMTERHTKGVIFQVLQGLKQLHQTHNLMHRDIKPENVLFDRRNGVVKLCDMGFAREDGPVMQDNVDGEDHEMTQYVSTRWYRAPELLLRRPRYSKSIDLWSVGCLVVEMLAGKPAFPAENDVGVLGMISEVLGWRIRDRGIRLRGYLHGVNAAYGEGQVAARDKARRHCMWLKSWLAAQEEVTRSFILVCLRPDPQERATVLDLLDHPWISSMDWMDGNFARRIEESMNRTASIQARVTACRRLRMALTKKGHTGYQERHRQQSMVAEKTSKASHLIKPAYFTPQVAGVGAMPHSNAQHAPAGTIGAVFATPQAAHQKKKSTNSYWLETPGGGMISPILNHAMPVPEGSPLMDTIQPPKAVEVKADNEVDDGVQSKRSLAKRLLDKLKL